jgi:ABC-type glycerol-3-phosphate transport system permease component
MHRLSVLSLIVIGVCLVALGISFNFQLERHSLNEDGVDKEFVFLEYTSLPMVLLGLLTTVVGSTIWAWRRASVSSLVLSGAALAILTSLAAKLIPINIHGWTGSFMFVFVASLLIGVLFFVFAAVRFTSSRLGLRRK